LNKRVDDDQLTTNRVYRFLTSKRSRVSDNQLLWFAKILSDRDFNRIQGCRPQAKCDSTLGWSTPFGYS
jgi:hypothetical protein